MGVGGLLMGVGGPGRAGRGSREGAAAELLRGGERTVETDVYAFGITLWEMMARASPYDGEHASDVLDKARRPPSPPPPPDQCGTCRDGTRSRGRAAGGRGAGARGAGGARAAEGAARPSVGAWHGSPWRVRSPQGGARSWLDGVDPLRAALARGRIGWKDRLVVG